MSILHNHEPEAELLKKTMHLAQLSGWRAVHMTPAQSSKGRWATHGQGDITGWPDIFAVRGHHAIALELKAEKGRLTVPQKAWLEALSATGIAAHVYRPSDWDLIERILR